MTVAVPEIYTHRNSRFKFRPLPSAFCSLHLPQEALTNVHSARRRVNPIPCTYIVEINTENILEIRETQVKGKKTVFFRIL